MSPPPATSYSPAPPQVLTSSQDLPETAENDDLFDLALEDPVQTPEEEEEAKQLKAKKAAEIRARLEEKKARSRRVKEKEQKKEEEEEEEEEQKIESSTNRLKARLASRESRSSGRSARAEV